MTPQVSPAPVPVVLKKTVLSRLGRHVRASRHVHWSRCGFALLENLSRRLPAPAPGHSSRCCQHGCWSRESPGGSAGLGCPPPGCREQVWAERGGLAVEGDLSALACKSPGRERVRHLGRGRQKQHKGTQVHLRDHAEISLS